MTDIIQLGDISIEVTRKDVKHVHLSVHPPTGRVTLVVEIGSSFRVLAGDVGEHPPELTDELVDEVFAGRS